MSKKVVSAAGLIAAGAILVGGTHVYGAAGPTHRGAAATTHATVASPEQDADTVTVAQTGQHGSVAKEHVGNARVAQTGQHGSTTEQNVDKGQVEQTGQHGATAGDQSGATGESSSGPGDQGSSANN
jgi:hypothetical protein